MKILDIERDIYPNLATINSASPEGVCHAPVQPIAMSAILSRTPRFG